MSVTAAVSSSVQTVVTVRTVINKAVMWCLCQHDAQMDYYGTKLATCSSDRSVKIFDVRGDQQVLVADLKGLVYALTLYTVILDYLVINDENSALYKLYTVISASVELAY